MKGIKSGQMEIIGLVIIVILISLGMLFMAKFAIDDSNQEKIFTREGLAYGTLSSIMKNSVTYPDCIVGYNPGVKPQMGKDIIEDCATYHDFSDYSIYNCKGYHSCEFLEEELKLYLDNTLGVGKKRYVLESKLRTFDENIIPIIEPIISEKGGCSKIDRDCSDVELSSEGGDIITELCLCDLS